MNWRDYQEQAAEIFRSLGCEVAVEASVGGARSVHQVDVWVRFKRFGLEVRWVVECKYWNSPVTKEAVLTLRSVVEDVGADRGILLSLTGFQSGAIAAASHTNITLSDLPELRASVRDDMIVLALHDLEVRAVRVKEGLFAVQERKELGPNQWSVKSLPGVDGNAVFRAFGALSVLDFGFDRARLRNSPYPVAFGADGQSAVAAKNLEEFIQLASKCVDEASHTLDLQRSRLAAARAGAATSTDGE